MTNDIAVTFLPGDTITAAKLNAMQQSLAVEGDYTSYKYVWGRDYFNVITGNLLVVNVTNDGAVLFTDSTYTTTLYKKTYSGAESSTAGYKTLTSPAWYQLTSVLHTYEAHVNTATSATTVHIYKNGSVIQTLDTSDDNTDCDTNTYCFFSANGRYLAIVSEPVGESASAYLMLYEADV